MTNSDLLDTLLNLSAFHSQVGDLLIAYRTVVGVVCAGRCCILRTSGGQMFLDVLTANHSKVRYLGSLVNLAM